MKFDLRDIFAFGGLGLVACGLYMIYPPAAFIIPGLFFVWLGVKRG
ncbi:hypothetical protein [Peribacillus asahii]|nr:hypothetical protein [Peribacillus asahii]USK85718.1 hypothetical protein LIT35_03365 [Peribacillus asahii]